MILALASMAFALAQPPGAVGPGTVEAGRKQFETRCAGCHGKDGAGGERAPAVSRPGREKLSASELREIIRNGIPEGGMPSFRLPETQLTELVAFVQSRAAPAAASTVPGNSAAGRAFFFGNGRCAGCHKIGGAGGRNGPDLTHTGRDLTLAEIQQTLRQPNAHRRPGYEVAAVRLKSGAELRGFVRNESNFDLQLQGFDERLHLLLRDDIADIRREPGSYMPPLEATPEEARYLIRLSGPGLTLTHAGASLDPACAGLEAGGLAVVPRPRGRKPAQRP